MYDQLDPLCQQYVDVLIEHAKTALWPERMRALESFRQGIEGCPEPDLAAAADCLLDDRPPEIAPADILYRAIITAYVERLGIDEVTNPDQARLYGLSFATEHREHAAAWLEDHPEYRGTEEST